MLPCFAGDYFGKRFARAYHFTQAGTGYLTRLNGCLMAILDGNTFKKADVSTVSHLAESWNVELQLHTDPRNPHTTCHTLKAAGLLLQTLTFMTMHVTLRTSGYTNLRG